MFFDTDRLTAATLVCLLLLAGQYVDPFVCMYTPSFLKASVPNRHAVIISTIAMRVPSKKSRIEEQTASDHEGIGFD